MMLSAAKIVPAKAGHKFHFSTKSLRLK